MCEWVNPAGMLFLLKWYEVPSCHVLFTCTTSTTGSEDEKIHCFKPGEPCEGCRSVLADEMKKPSTSDHDDSDLFASDNDEEELENELCKEGEDEEEDGSRELETEDSESEMETENSEVEAEI